MRKLTLILVLLALSSCRDKKSGGGRVALPDPPRPRGALVLVDPSTGGLTHAGDVYIPEPTPAGPEPSVGWVVPLPLPPEEPSEPAGTLGTPND